MFSIILHLLCYINISLHKIAGFVTTSYVLARTSSKNSVYSYYQYFTHSNDLSVLRYPIALVLYVRPLLFSALQRALQRLCFLFCLTRIPSFSLMGHSVSHWPYHHILALLVTWALGLTAWR